VPALLPKNEMKKFRLLFEYAVHCATSLEFHETRYTTV
jgi:hypothetical protein